MTNFSCLCLILCCNIVYCLLHNLCRDKALEYRDITFNHSLGILLNLCGDIQRNVTTCYTACLCCDIPSTILLGSLHNLCRNILWKCHDITSSVVCLSFCCNHILLLRQSSIGTKAFFSIYVATIKQMSRHSFNHYALSIVVTLVTLLQQYYTSCFSQNFCFFLLFCFFSLNFCKTQIWVKTI